MKYILGADFILSYLIEDDKEKFNKAKELFDKAKSGHIILALEQVVFAEIVFILNSLESLRNQKPELFFPFLSF